VADPDRVARFVERGEDRAAEAGRRVMVLSDHDPVPGRGRGREQGLVSIGLTEHRSTTRAPMPSSASWPTAARQLCRVTPAPITWSFGPDRTTFAPQSMRT
jgi:hypothetical protein